MTVLFRLPDGDWPLDDEEATLLAENLHRDTEEGEEERNVARAIEDRLVTATDAPLTPNRTQTSILRDALDTTMLLQSSRWRDLFNAPSRALGVHETSIGPEDADPD